MDFLEVQGVAATSNTVTVIWFWVSVPVLSEQMTVTEPRVSTAGSWRISDAAAGMLRPQRQGDGHHRGQVGNRRHRHADGRGT